jgi:SAM-dependent methyltransferase
MVPSPSNPPYFDLLFARLDAADPSAVAAFGRHVHWGYWNDADHVTVSAEDYGAAAERLCRVLCDQAPIRDGQRILDVGCGFGGTIASLNERFDRVELVGLNIDERQLRRAASQVRARSENVIAFVEADAMMLPLPDDHFDIVLAVECIFHFDRAQFLGEASRVLRPGGSLTISDFVPSQQAAEYFEAIDFSADEAIRWSYGNIDLSCSVDRYWEMAESWGLKLIEATDITANTLPTYEFLRSSMDGWADDRERKLFGRATGLLEKASRRGMLGYQVITFQKK